MILRTQLVFAVTVVVLLCAATIKRSMVYIDEMTLWSDAVAKSPAKARPLTMVGLEFQKRFDNDKAILYFEQAVKAQPDCPEALNNLANLYVQSGRRDLAVELFQRAVLSAPRSLPFRSNLAITYYSAGMLDKSKNEYAIIITLAPRSPEAAFARYMLNEIQKAASGH